jgi:hypothetical protein
MQCAVGKISAQKGFRINLTENSAGDLALNLLEGTTVSGSKYAAKKSSGANSEIPGTYEGVRKDRFHLKLVVSKTKAANKYIDGYTATIEVNFEDLRRASGQNTYRSAKSDNFVCGKKIADFGS